MGVLIVTRSALLLVMLVFSLVVLGLNANFLNLSTPHGHDDDDDDDDHHHRTFGFESTGVAVAALTMLTVIPVLVMSFIRRRSVISLVLFEIGWVSILMILWVVTAGQASGTSIFVDGCSNTDDDLQSMCNQFQAIQAFSWLNFVLLLLWLVTIIVVAAMAHNRGHTRVWTYPFSDAAFLSGHPSPSTGVVETKSRAFTPNQPVLMQQSGEQSQGHPTQSPQTASPQGYQGTPPLQQGQHQSISVPQQGQHQGTPPPQQQSVTLLPQV